MVVRRGLSILISIKFFAIIGSIYSKKNCFLIYEQLNIFALLGLRLDFDANVINSLWNSTLKIGDEMLEKLGRVWSSCFKSIIL